MIAEIKDKHNIIPRGALSGPWRHENDSVMLDPVTEEPVTGVRAMNDDGWLVAEIYHSDPQTVRLMLAAPELHFACRCALADLEGIMPDHDPCGEHSHPGWKTIGELKKALATCIL